MVTRAKASFSIGEYLSSTPQSAWLVKYKDFCNPPSSLTKAALIAAGETTR